jgi:hypothetical protein
MARFALYVRPLQSPRGAVGSLVVLLPTDGIVTIGRDPAAW